MATDFAPGGSVPGAQPEILAMARPGETWLDIGAGAGRVSTELAPLVRQVIACEPSPGMHARLRETAAAQREGTLTVLDPTPWPPTLDVPEVDVAVAVMVVFFVREIGPFIDAMERHARERCIVVVTKYSAGKPQSLDLWAQVHGEPYQLGPAVREFIPALLARGTVPDVRLIGMTCAVPERMESLDEAVTLNRRRFLVTEGSVQEVRLREGLEQLYGHADGSVGPIPWDNEYFIVSWSPSEQLGMG